VEKSTEVTEGETKPVESKPAEAKSFKELMEARRTRAGAAPTTPTTPTTPTAPKPTAPTPANLTSVPASKKKVRVPAYVRKHLDKTEDGEPLLYITQAPNQGSGVNISRHRYKIKANILKEEKAKWEQAGRKWEDLDEQIKDDIRKTADKRADRIMNSWIDDQRGAETVWVKGDPQYEKDELIKKAQDSIEALIFPQQTEVITKTDVGKTFQQMNDFEGPLGWLSYVGRFAPSTLVSTAIAGGGWGTPEQIKAIKGGKDILSYTPDLGDWITDHAENMGLISEETSNHWWTNAIVGGLVTVPVMLAEPDILTPVIAGAGTLAGGPVGTAGGFLLAKGSKGLKALPTLGKLKRITKVAEDGKEMLAKVADESSDIKLREATKVLGSLTGSTGRVVRNVLASVISTNNPSNRLKNTIAKQIDELQESRKAAPDVVESLEKIEDLEEYLNLPGAEPEKLADLLAGNEENLVKYYQSKALANKLLDEEMQLNRRLANSYSQFKPKQQSAKEYRQLTGALENSYKQLDEVEAAINKSGATDALRQQRSKLISDIQKNQRLLSKANAEQALEIASKRADVANELLFKSAN
jgi:hypothetical protein